MEEIKFLKGLSFLWESIISILIMMVLFYFIVCLFVGVSYVYEFISNG